jgi:hypothetical protein
MGIPFGPYGAWDQTTRQPNTGMFTASLEGTSPGQIVELLAAARKANKRLILAMTGGAHSLNNPGNYLSKIDGVLQFDFAKWKARMNQYNTPAIRSALAEDAERAQPTVLGNSVMDEPNVWAAPGTDGNTWGPEGTMDKGRVDELCAYGKKIFPGLPMGVTHQWQWLNDKSYQQLDFLVSQYATRKGPVAAYRDGGLKLAARDGHAIGFSMNLLNGGMQDRDGTWDCKGTGGKGTRPPNCRMTAAQVQEYGLTLGPAGAVLLMWPYEAAFMSRSDNQAAFRAVGAKLAALPTKSLRRTN